MGFIPEWAIGVSFIIFASALAKIVMGMLRSSSRKLPDQDQEVGELRQAFEAMQSRVGELEERVDFTERLLANRREADRLEPPPH